MTKEKRNIKADTYIGLDVVRKIGIERVLSVVCEHTGVTRDEMISQTRAAEIVAARHAFCYLAYHAINNHTLKEIGKVINRDHATVLHGKNKIQDFIDFDKRVKKLITDLKVKLGGFCKEDVETNRETNRLTKDHVGYYNTPMKKLELRENCQKTDLVSKIKC
jgi:hypothetical protein